MPIAVFHLYDHVCVMPKMLNEGPLHKVSREHVPAASLSTRKVSLVSRMSNQ